MALTSAACLAFEREWLLEPLAAPASATAVGRGSSAGVIAKAGHGPTSNSTAFCPYLPLEFGHGRGPPGSSIRPEVIAAAVRPPETEVVVVAAAGAGDGAPFVGFRRSAGLPPWSGVVHACRGGTGVPFVMALRVPGFFVHCGFWGLNMYVTSARSRVFSSFSSAKTRLSII
jgi:hypothetical protein